MRLLVYVLFVAVSSMVVAGSCLAKQRAPDGREEAKPESESAVSVLQDDVIRSIIYGYEGPTIGWNYDDGWRSHWQVGADFALLLDHKNEETVRQTLRAAAYDPNPGIRVMATFALFRMRDAPEERLSSLLDGLVSEDWTERRVARQLLTNNLASRSDPELEALLPAGTSLDRIDLHGETDIEYVPTILDKLRSENAAMRAAALSVLWKFTDEPTVMSAILELTHEESAEVRASAIGDLRWAPVSDPARRQDLALVERIIALTRDSDPGVRAAAIAALEFYAPSIDSIQAVTTGVTDIDPRVRRNSVMILPSLAEPADSLPAIIPALQDADPSVVRAAIDVLASMGPAARAALSELRKLQSSPDTNLSEYVSNAIRHIEDQE